MLTDTLKTGIYIAFLKDEQWRIREAEWFTQEWKDRLSIDMGLEPESLCL